MDQTTPRCGKLRPMAYRSSPPFPAVHNVSVQCEQCSDFRGFPRVARDGSRLQTRSERSRSPYRSTGFRYGFEPGPNSQRWRSVAIFPCFCHASRGFGNTSVLTPGEVSPGRGLAIPALQLNVRLTVSMGGRNANRREARKNPQVICLQGSIREMF